MIKHLKWAIIFFTHIVFAQEVETIFESETTGETQYQNKFDDSNLISQLRNNDVQVIEDAFRKNDYAKLIPFLHPKINSDSLKQYFTKAISFLDKESWKTMDYYDNRNTGSHFQDEVLRNILKLEHRKNKDFTTNTISYTYYVKDSTLFINSIAFVFDHLSRQNGKLIQYHNRMKLPLELNKFKSTINNFFDCRTLKCATDFEREIKIQYDSLQEFNYSFLNSEKFDKSLSFCYNRICWELLMLKKYKNALIASKKSTELYPSMYDYQINLVISYLLNEQFDKAKQKYDTLKDKELSDTWLFSKTLKRSLNYFEKKGITNPNFQKMRDYME